MRPADLFDNALSVPAHESNDLHYIGEAIPSPYQTVGGDINGVNSVGTSSVPAREDHVHRIDLSDYYTESEVDALIPDLSGYVTSAYLTAYHYTKTYITTNYYTKTYITTNFYTKTEVDDLLGDFDGEMSWGYAEEVCDPVGEVFSSVWYPPQNIRILEFWAGCKVGATSGYHYTVKMYTNTLEVESFVFDQTDTYEIDDVTRVVSAGVGISVSIQMSDATEIGDAENMAIGIRYEYV